MLTTRVTDRTADIFVIDGSTSVYVQSALLHYTGRHVSDAVAVFAGFVRGGRYFRAFGEVFSVDAATVLVQFSDTSGAILGRRCCRC